MDDHDRDTSDNDDKRGPAKENKGKEKIEQHLAREKKNPIQPTRNSFEPLLDIGTDSSGEDDDDDDDDGDNIESKRSYDVQEPRKCYPGLKYVVVNKGKPTEEKHTSGMTSSQGNNEDDATENRNDEKEWRRKSKKKKKEK